MGNGTVQQLVFEGDRVVLGEFPTEVQPLVNDLNALLAHRDRRVADALAKAGDLAHGLKTPLAILALDGELDVLGSLDRRDRDAAQYGTTRAGDVPAAVPINHATTVPRSGQ